MDEAREGQAQGAGRRRGLRWLAEVTGTWEGAQPPAVGTWVDGYRLETHLGEGGQGAVYRARKGRHLFALKFLSLEKNDWAWRELEVGVRLRRAGSLPVLGHALWPSDVPRYIYLVFPYVKGRPLSEWVQERNPTAREGVRLLREVAWQLARAHRLGVVHRDIKGANVLVRREDDQPVLVDFGVGTYVGALEITHPFALPGTPLYRSPEALRFRREHLGQHAPPRASDDLWALGVVLYELLTGRHPFDPEEPCDDEGELATVILEEVPEPPHLLNPRVPRALSELCLRMLEKSREARFANAQDVCAAMDAVLAEADGAWDVALCTAWTPEEATTSSELWLDMDDWVDKARRLRRYTRLHPRRGRPAPSEEATTAPGRSEPLPAPVAPSEERPLRPRSRVARVAWRLGLAGLLLLPCSVSGTRSDEGGRGAVLQDSMQAMTPSSSPQSPSPSVLGSMVRACGTALVMGQLACATAPVPSQAETLPPPAACPAGALESLKELDLGVGSEEVVALPAPHNERYVILKMDDPLELGPPLGIFPSNTVFTGQYFIGKERVYGRFTRAQIPGGKSYPVCMELYGLGPEPVRGMPLEPGSTPGAARVLSTARLRVVERFE